MASDKKKILVFGGIGKNIPTWVIRAFNVEHYQQEAHFKREIAPESRPDVVIVLKSWISHKQAADAREFSDMNGIPFLYSDGGWSQAVQKAIESGLDWFPEALNKTLSTLDEEVFKEVDNVLERAWECAYRREFERAAALEKRLKKDRNKLETISTKLDLAEKREHAANRVILEIREAALITRQRQEEVLRIYRVVLDHINELSIQPDVVLELKRKIDKLLET